MLKLDGVKKSRVSRYFPLILVIVFGLLLRLLWLDRVPTAITGDELDYVLDAKVIFLSGRDWTGTWSPFSLTPAPHRVPKAELPSLVIAPLIGPMKLSLFSARLPYVIWGVIFLITLFLIAKRFFGAQAALIVTTVAAINPWTFYFSRTAFDIPLAGIFFFIAFCLLIYLKGQRLLLAFPFFLLAFFSYIGTKLIFIPFALVTSFYSWSVLNRRKFTLQYLLLILLCFLLFGWFLFSLRHEVVGVRTGELLTPFHSSVVQRVNEERRLSTRHPLMFLFSNKGVVFGKVFLEKYLKIFSVDFLFLHGEGRATYSVWTHGLFYYLDLIFILLGFYFLFIKDRKLFFFLVTLMLIAPLPAAMSTVGEEYALRGVLLYPNLILLTGLGIWALVSFKKGRCYRLGVTSFLIAVYCFQLANFLNTYFFRNPIYNSEGFGFSGRVLVDYINRAKPEAERIMVVSKDQLGFFKEYLFYSDVVNQGSLVLIRRMIAQGEYHWENVYFIQEATKSPVIGEKDIIISLSDFPPLDNREIPYWLSIARLSDGGEIYKIWNDPICFRFDLGRYPSEIKFGDLKVESLSEERFCEKYITDLTGYVDFKRKQFQN